MNKAAGEEQRERQRQERKTKKKAEGLGNIAQLPAALRKRAAQLAEDPATLPAFTSDNRIEGAQKFIGLTILSRLAQKHITKRVKVPHD